MHHSCIWYFYLRTGEWAVPPSGFYTQLGQVSVALFFMITGFLFTAELVSTPANKMDWLRLYTSRVLRITPLWLAVKIAVVVLAAVMRYWHWDQGNPPLFPSTASTGLMTASVAWILYYEWTFYLALPLIAWALARRTSWLAPIVVALSYASYRCIEMPALRQTNAWTAWLRAQLQRNPLRKSRQR